MTTQTDVICPPNQDAECAACGDALKFHWVESSDIAKDIGAVCPNTYGDVFALAGGETLDCPNVTQCTVCDTDLCTQHTTEFTTCPGGEGLHHLDCRFNCLSCTANAREERDW